MAFHNITDWINSNIPNSATAIKSEEDFKNKAMIPFLNSLGYNSSDMSFEVKIDTQAGTKKFSVFSDITIADNGRIEIIIDTKAPNEAIGESSILQATSYAKLISTPPALYGIVSNGKETAVTNIYTGKRTEDFPDKATLISEISKTRKKSLSEIEIREVNSLLLTLTDADELYRIIKKCKDIIEKKGLIRSDQSFKEMTKILLVKMNEEKRAKTGKNNRFQTTYIEKAALANKVSFLEEFKYLFSNAISEYPIYTDPSTTIGITDESCIQEIVKELEPWSFLGTGSDIKGAVYEIFLKSTLRGDFDQYFTPREIVDFMVKFANPNIGDKILDPACGSGGFLIQSFLYVNRKISNSPFSDKEAKNKFDKLIDKCLWGGEADEDLHVLAKINLIMHGDGYNNIYQGDSLTNSKIPNEFFDLILTNPPFTIQYNFKDVLSLYETGKGCQTQELDILFTERCINALDNKKGGELYIVLPEGLLNLPCYKNFREWLLRKCYLTLSVSLPEGAFIPFGKSVSKTCILGLRKKGENNKPDYAFMCNAKAVGYDVGKTNYKEIAQNDLPLFIRESREFLTGSIKQIMVENAHGFPKMISHPIALMQII